MAHCISQLLLLHSYTFSPRCLCCAVISDISCSHQLIISILQLSDPPSLSAYHIASSPFKIHSISAFSSLMQPMCSPSTDPSAPVSSESSGAVVPSAHQCQRDHQPTPPLLDSRWIHLAAAQSRRSKKSPFGVQTTNTPPMIINNHTSSVR